jgi:hypothetical protein
MARGKWWVEIGFGVASAATVSTYFLVAGDHLNTTALLTAGTLGAALFTGVAALAAMRAAQRSDDAAQRLDVALSRATLALGRTQAPMLWARVMPTEGVLRLTMNPNSVAATRVTARVRIGTWDSGDLPPIDRVVPSGQLDASVKSGRWSCPPTSTRTPVRSDHPSILGPQRPDSSTGQNVGCPPTWRVRRPHGG